jgi:1-acyl-sn-glycerol-3-phosphate acyltransferase
MERWELTAVPPWFSPRMCPRLVRLLRPIRLLKQWREHRLRSVEVRGLEHLLEPVQRGQGVLITPNHAGHADAYVLPHAADRVGRPFHFMVAWQVIAKQGPLGRLTLRAHGCFSVDREGSDLRAFRQAVEILQGSPYPLIIFPEGEVYHVNDRITPFREGNAAIALAAAKRAQRPVVCVPAAIKYQYVEDPTPELQQLMTRLEERILWRPRPDLSLRERVERFAVGLQTLRELEYLGQAQTGNLAERNAGLSDALLERVEARYGRQDRNTSVPERVKTLRHQVLKQLAGVPPDDPRRFQADRDLDDLFAVVQLFSYPADYVAENPTLERVAETIDKFEEDVFGIPTATPRGVRRAVVSFGEPVEAPSQRKKEDVALLTKTLEQRVQALLDGIGCGQLAVK